MEDKSQEKLDKLFLEYGYTLDDFIDDLIRYRNLHGGDGEVWIGHTKIICVSIHRIACVQYL
jgi:hypothetical protein